MENQTLELLGAVEVLLQNGRVSSFEVRFLTALEG